MPRQHLALVPKLAPPLSAVCFHCRHAVFLNQPIGQARHGVVTMHNQDGAQRGAGFPAVAAISSTLLLAFPDAAAGFPALLSSRMYFHQHVAVYDENSAQRAAYLVDDRRIAHDVRICCHRARSRHSLTSCSNTSRHISATSSSVLTASEASMTIRGLP